ncbi:TetR family transcriptional regulator [Ruania alkalisoli]|uniref:TetR family transcriptional regulator n=2 Tax=Ruania alkalisoli TaxID=2779775 RepID=A0A7M1SYX2_9MICO|nr:TetR family transcriptional regulator [Ruania alkalisoli]
MSRRLVLADAGLAVIAEEGMRGLTHRAVDRRAGVPPGTTSNYFRTRRDLIVALTERLYRRLTPEDAALVEAAAREPTRDQWVRLMVELVERALAQPALHVALWEIRLEAVRRPELMPVLTELVRGGFRADVAFLHRSRLPGTAHEVRLLHLAINGLILELLTLPDALEVGDWPAIAADLVDRIVYATPGARVPLGDIER